ncbi:MAG: chemotaxis protein CheD, partial [Pirellulales bacterium]|nr:chemotaxis protein CheD [Pirellulales bacterium]
MITLVDAGYKCEPVGMGMISVANHPHELYSVLGSCIGVAIVDPRAKLGVLAHVVLPESNGRRGSPGRFADTAIPHMLELLKERGAARRGLVVKMAGGAQMFACSSQLQIGDANAAAVRRVLRSAGLAIHAEDIGGTEGRKITVDCATAQLTICRVGRPEIV